MTNPADSSVQNLLPVQAYFNTDGSFNTFIGQGVPFTATISPNQSGLNITSSTINSTTIGVTTPAVGYFTSGFVSVSPTTATGIANKQYVDYYAAGLSWKQPVKAASLANIATLSGFQTIDAVPLTDGDRVLVKNQSLSKNNGIYVVRTGAWEYAVGADNWEEYVGAIVFVEEGSQAYSAWYSLAQEGGTLGVTALDWANFSVSSTYSAGTGLTLNAGVFSITNTGVTNATYGSATTSAVIAVNAQGQITSASNSTITPAVGSITGLGTGVATALAAGVTGSGNIVLATSPSLVTPVLGTPTSGNFSTGTFTWPTFNQNTTGTASKATNIVGGAAGSVPYQTATDTTGFLAAGTNGQVLTLASGVPSWATPTTGTVTSVAGTGTVNGITLTGTVTSSGSLTLGGTLGSIANSQLTNSSITFGATAAALGTTVSGFNAVTIGATTASTGAFTVLSTSSATSTTPVLGYNASNTNLALGGTVSGTYLQAVMQNKSGTAGASTNFAVSNDLGTDSTYYGEFGMNSSVFSSGTPADFFSLNNGVYFSSHDGDVTIGSGNGYKTYLAWGTTGQSAHVINATGAIGLNTSITGSTNFGTSGQVLTSAGSAATPTWTSLPASSITITDDTTTNATRYLAFTSATSGTITGQNVASTKLQFNPSTGVLTSTSFTGAGTGLTGTASSLSIGGSAASVANALTAGTGLTATATFNGSAAITFNATGTTINSQTTGYTLLATDAGKTISITTGGVTVPNAVLSAGNIVSIYNNSGSSQTITQGTSVTLQWAGQSSSSTGNRTLGLYGLCTIVFISSSNAVITGSGLT